MIAEIAGAVSGMLGPILGYAGQQTTNQSNETIAKDTTSASMAEGQRNRDFQSAQAERQMQFQGGQVAAQRDWQTQMSNTAHQREMADLKAAGLNPILTATGGQGSSTPSGSAASGASGSGAQGQAHAIPMQNPAAGLGHLASSALEAVTLLGGLKKQEAETGFINAQTKKTGVDTEVAKKGVPKSELLNDLYDTIRPLIKKVKEGVESGVPRETIQRRDNSDRLPSVRGFDPKTKQFNLTYP